MSKSDGNQQATIFINDSPDLISKKISKAVTDSLPGISYDHDKRPGLSNLIDLMSAINGSSQDEIAAEYHSKGAAEFKRNLSDTVIQHLAPIQSEILRLQTDPGYVDSILRNGSEQAEKLASESYARISKALGII